MTTSNQKLGWFSEPASIPGQGLTELFLNQSTAKWTANNVLISFNFERPTKLRGLSVRPKSNQREENAGLFITMDDEPHSGHTLECNKQTDLVFQNVIETTKLELNFSCEAMVELEFLVLSVAEEELHVMQDTLTDDEKLHEAKDKELKRLTVLADALKGQIATLTTELNTILRDNLELGRENEKLKAQLSGHDHNSRQQ